jgi:hypothetical protein
MYGWVLPVIALLVGAFPLALTAAQSAPWSLVQSSDGVLWVLTDGARHRIAPQPIGDTVLASIPEAAPWDDGAMVASGLTGQPAIQPTLTPEQQAQAFAGQCFQIAATADAKSPLPGSTDALRALHQIYLHAAAEAGARGVQCFQWATETVLPKGARLLPGPGSGETAAKGFVAAIQLCIAGQ